MSMLCLLNANPPNRSAENWRRWKEGYVAIKCDPLLCVMLLRDELQRDTEGDLALLLSWTGCLP